MSFTIVYNSWNPPKPGERLRQLKFSWTTNLNATNEAEIERVIGYIYALLIQDDNSSIIVTDPNGVTTNKPYQLQVMRGTFITSGYPPPGVEEPVQDYFNRIGMPFNRFKKQYVLIVSPRDEDDGDVDILQFNHLEFLQGFLSVLQGFHQPTMRYIVTIYDRNGVEYTVR